MMLKFVWCLKFDVRILVQLILELDSYIEELKKTQGAIAEFVNPK